MKQTQEQKEVARRKVVVVGDGATGKTSLLQAYTCKTYLQEHLPTIMETQLVTVPVAGSKLVELSLWDTAGQEDYDRLRPLAYPRTHVFIVCFSVDSYQSYMNVSAKWLLELRHFNRRTPIVLVATKTDLRYSSAATGRNTQQRTIVSAMEGEQLASRMQANSYLECSAKTQQGVDDVFQVVAALSLKQNKPKTGGQCTLL